MKERSELISYLRGEIVGPSVPMCTAEIIEFSNDHFVEPMPGRRGALAWRPGEGEELEEVLFYDRETPFRKYGAGLLHPERIDPFITPGQQAAIATDTVGIEDSEVDDTGTPVPDDGDGQANEADLPSSGGDDCTLDFDVATPDVRRPSTMAISLCARVGSDGFLVVKLPRSRFFSWQEPDDRPFALNGRYEEAKRTEQLEGGLGRESFVWRRLPAVPADCELRISAAELSPGVPMRRSIEASGPKGPLLFVAVFPRRLSGRSDHYLITVVLRNERVTKTKKEGHEASLYQSYFEVSIEGGEIVRYPESRRKFSDLDDDEQSLALLYRDSATWAIGHGCAAGWDSLPGTNPPMVYADVMPAVELPSMTPDIRDSRGDVIELRMRDLALLPDDGTGGAWASLESLASEYESWVDARRVNAEALEAHLVDVADRHLATCDETLARIRSGIKLLRDDAAIRSSFRLANLSMLLQQIATKKLARRSIIWDKRKRCPMPVGAGPDPWSVYAGADEGEKVGRWRAFQLAFLLMQLEGISDPNSTNRPIIDLIWFPTGGGKTEAYLGVMSFLLWHQRMLMRKGAGVPPRDGTNVLMRYTLRMLTTQQFQRAASLICAMEFLRRRPAFCPEAAVPGRRFSLGLWIGGDGTPNKNKDAASALREFKSDRTGGNPLVLTECPWCRTEIGRCQTGGGKFELAGIAEVSDGAMLFCVDPSCEFGQENQRTWLPVEVIDERIYRTVPSIVIATADKFAMMAYRPEAGILLGRGFEDEHPARVFHPPSLIVQDELHLIAGPLGTMYGLYEAVIERLCSMGNEERRVLPKIIASTATIRGAESQTLALYGRVRPRNLRSNVRLFPSPGLTMGDSFFGVYATRNDGSLDSGRLYLGFHTSNYGSILTAQVRVYSSALCRPATFADSSEARDPWWTLLGFYNSIRELGGARTLFDSDIRSRLKFLQNREAIADERRRHLYTVEELTSRLSQSEIVGMMDSLAVRYGSTAPHPLDACLASSIIEVGVDIDRLSLMGVSGQPKTTAQYIQVTGRVGRRWESRPGLILTLFNPGKSRDRSHFEQFHSYHRRLYERVEPTSATPFALSAIQRALPGVLILWARQHCKSDVSDVSAYRPAIEEASSFLIERCKLVQHAVDSDRAVAEIERIRDELLAKWGRNPEKFEAFPPSTEGDYLMLWPGQFSTAIQKKNGVEVPSSMRQVDRSGELSITDGYALQN